MKAIELFSGAGGSALGLCGSGVTELTCYDYDPYATAVLAHNFEIFKNAGITLDIQGRNLLSDPVTKEQNVDLLIAGPPCQPFSLGGKRFGFNDIRSGFGSVRKSIDKLRPRVFVIENVEGITARYFVDELSDWIASVAGCRRGRSIESVSEGYLSGGKYSVFWSVLNAADYGLPQLRKRWFLVGFREDVEPAKFCWPKSTHSYEALYHQQIVSGKYWKKHDLHIPSNFPWLKRQPNGEVCLLQPWLSCRDVISDLPPPIRRKKISYEYGHFLRPGARSYRGHSGSWVDFPSKTIKAGSHGVPGGENMIRHINGGTRYMTLLECSLIQGFPVEYHFLGGFKNSMRMIGNACPPVLMDKILESALSLETQSEDTKARRA